MNYNLVVKKVIILTNAQYSLQSIEVMLLKFTVLKIIT